MSASHLISKWDCEVACLQQRDDVQQHFHPWLASRLRMLRNKPHVQVLSQRSAIHACSDWIDAKLIPAPMTTLDSPRHNDMYPSIREIVAIALPMPVYMAAGVGLTTCIRVYDACQQSRIFLVSATSNAYLEQIDGIHDRVFLRQYQSSVSPSPQSVCGLTAMPAKAPATILAASEKFGGSPS